MEGGRCSWFLGAGGLRRLGQLGWGYHLGVVLELGVEAESGARLPARAGSAYGQSSVSSEAPARRASQ
jgi:hypothetical protein